VGIRNPRARGVVCACGAVRVRPGGPHVDHGAHRVGHGARAGPCIRTLLRHVEGGSSSWIKQGRPRSGREGGSRGDLEAVRPCTGSEAVGSCRGVGEREEGGERGQWRPVRHGGRRRLQLRREERRKKI
jgi:hypothetical protein